MSAAYKIFFLVDRMWIYLRLLLFLGATGSGKTLMMKILLRYLLRHIPRETDTGLRCTVNPKTDRMYDTKTIIFDFKGDMIPWCQRQKIPHKVFHPLLDYSIELDIASMVAQSEHNASRIAKKLIPESSQGKNDYFFTNAVRGIVKQAMLSLHEERPNAWSFQDLYLSVMQVASLKKLLNKTDAGKAKVISILKAKSASDVLATISEKLEFLEILAKSWDGTGTKFTFDDFLKNNYALILPYDTRYKAESEQIYSFIISLICEEIEALPDNDDRRIVLSLDELQNIGHIEGLAEFINTARSKGVCVMAGIQNISGLYAKYDKDEADAILSSFRNRAYFACDGLSAEWAVKQIGNHYVSKTSEQISLSSSSLCHLSKNSSVVEHQEMKNVYCTSELTMLPTANKVTLRQLYLTLGKKSDLMMALLTNKGAQHESSLRRLSKRFRALAPYTNWNEKHTPTPYRQSVRITRGYPKGNFGEKIKS